MKFSLQDLNSHAHDLDALISKLVDLNHEILARFDDTLQFASLSAFDQTKFMSELKTQFLEIKAISNETDKFITKTFKRFPLQAEDLRKFSYSLRISANLENIAEQVYSAHKFLMSVKEESPEFSSLKQLWILTLRRHLKMLLFAFMQIYASKIEHISLSEILPKIQEHEDQIDTIYSEHTPSIVRMAKSDLICNESAFELTTAIRNLERAGDLIEEAIEYTLKIYYDGDYDIHQINSTQIS